MKDFVIFKLEKCLISEKCKNVQITFVKRPQFKLLVLKEKSMDFQFLKPKTFLVNNSFFRKNERLRRFQDMKQLSFFKKEKKNKLKLFERPSSLMKHFLTVRFIEHKKQILSLFKGFLFRL